jgi:hypothetical protein
MRSGGADPDGRPGDLYVTLKVSLFTLQFRSNYNLVALLMMKE